MPTIDPVADLLTRVRNAGLACKKAVNVVDSKLIRAVLDVLKREGYVEDYRVAEEGTERFLRVYLKYGLDGERAIREIRRVSKPSRRVYSPLKLLGRVRAGMGIKIVSTSKGVLSDRECRAQKVSGEIICEVV